MDRELELDEEKKMALVGNEKEDASAEMSNEGEPSASTEATEGLSVDEAATCVPEESAGLRNTAVNKDLDNEQPLSRDQNDALTTDSRDGPLSLNKTTSPTPEETTEIPAMALDKKDVRESMQALTKERDHASQQNRLLQGRLTGYFQKRPVSGGHLETGSPPTEQDYEKNIHFLTELKLQLSAASDSAQQQAEELRLQELKRLCQVEEEWRVLMALKQDAAVSALSRSLGKVAARAKVLSILTAEQLLQDELIKTRLQHFKLKFTIRRLEAEIHERDKQDKDSLQSQLKQLEVKKLEKKQQAEKKCEESLKLQTMISRSLELLSNVKEKLFWSQKEVEAKRQQLAELEATVARKKDHLTQNKLVQKKLQQGNLRLKEREGLLGNRVLLRDFEDTVDTSDHLETHLEDLKCQQAKTVFRCDRRKKRIETTLINE